LNGTLVNTAAIIAGGLIGISVGKHLPDRIKTIMVQALGLSVLLVGIQMALTVTDLIVTIGCMLVGAVTGELLRIEYWIERLGGGLKNVPARILRPLRKDSCPLPSSTLRAR